MWIQVYRDQNSPHKQGSLKLVVSRLTEDAQGHWIGTFYTVPMDSNVGILGSHQEDNVHKETEWDQAEAK